jgi:hypothetical protein
MEFGASVPHLTKASAGALVLATEVVEGAVVEIAVTVGFGLETTVVGGSCALTTKRRAIPAIRINRTAATVARLRRVVTRAPIRSLAAAFMAPRADSVACDSASH